MINKVTVPQPDLIYWTSDALPGAKLTLQNDHVTITDDSGSFYAYIPVSMCKTLGSALVSIANAVGSAT